MPMYHVIIEEYVSSSFAHPWKIIFSGFVKSEFLSVEKVKQSILDHHKKQGIEELRVTVSSANGIAEDRNERKYWYRIWKLICGSCGRVVSEERKRVFSKEIASTETEYIPVCDDCYRSIKGV